MVIGAANQSYFVKPENKYKIPSEAIDVVEIMNRNNGSENKLVGITFNVDESEVVSPEEFVFQGMRCYSAEYQYMRASEETLGEKKYSFVIADQTTNPNEFHQFGYELIASTQTFAIYQLR